MMFVRKILPVVSHFQWINKANVISGNSLPVSLNFYHQFTDLTYCRRTYIDVQNYDKCSIISGILHNHLRRLHSQTSNSEDEKFESPLDDGQFIQKVRKIGVTRGEQRTLLKKRPKRGPNQKILKVAIIGAPNAGKSTLANHLIGWKFSAVSSKVHTTRCKSLGILTENNTQIVFLDTPGFISPMQRRKYDMENTLLRDPHSSLYLADLIIAMVDASQIWGRNQLDVELQKALYLHRDKPTVLVLNKIDKFPHKHELLHAARILSEGQVDGKTNWYRSVKRDADRKRVSLKQLFHKVDSMTATGKLSSTELSNLPPHVTNCDLNTFDNNCDISRSGEHPAEPIKSTVANSSNNAEPVKSTVTKTSNNAEPMKSTVVNSPDDVEPIVSAVLHDNHEDRAENNLCRPKEMPNFRNQEEWHQYYTQQIRQIGEEIQSRVGFDGFTRVFYISALEGTSVDELRTYLLDSAYPGQWQYDKDVVTDQDPAVLAKMSVWERILDHLPNEVPYTVDLKNTVWAVDDEGLLHLEFELLVKKRYLFSFLSQRGQVIQRIAAEAKQELMNTFRREMTLKLIVKPADRKSKRKL